VCFIVKNGVQALGSNPDHFYLSASAGKIAFVAQSRYQVIVQNINRWSFPSSHDTYIDGFTFSEIDTASNGSYCLYKVTGAGTLRVYHSIFTALNNTDNSKFVQAAEIDFRGTIIRFSGSNRPFGGVVNGDVENCHIQHAGGTYGLTDNTWYANIRRSTFKDIATSGIHASAVTEGNFIENQTAGNVITGITQVDNLGFIDVDEPQQGVRETGDLITSIAETIITPQWYYDTSATGANNGNSGNDAFQTLADINTVQQVALAPGDVIQAVSGVHTDNIAGLDMTGYILIGEDKETTVLNLTGTSPHVGSNYFVFKDLQVNFTAKLTSNYFSGGADLIFDNCLWECLVTGLSNGFHDSGSPSGRISFINKTLAKASNSSTNTGRAWLRNTNFRIEHSIFIFTMVNSGNFPRFVNAGTLDLNSAVIWNEGAAITDTFGSLDTYVKTVVKGITTAPSGGTNWIFEIDGDPQFVQPSTGNFDLRETSPLLQ
jgi:hypothetical protein